MPIPSEPAAHYDRVHEVICAASCAAQVLFHATERTSDEIAARAVSVLLVNLQKLEAIRDDLEEAGADSKPPAVPVDLRQRLRALQTSVYQARSLVQALVKGLEAGNMEEPEAAAQGIAEYLGGLWLEMDAGKVLEVRS